MSAPIHIRRQRPRREVLGIWRRLISDHVETTLCGAGVTDQDVAYTDTPPADACHQCAALVTTINRLGGRQ